MSTDPDVPEGAAPAPRPKPSKLVPLLLLLNLAGTGASAFFALEAGKAAASIPNGAPNEGSQPPVGSGPVVVLDAFVVNLNEPGGTSRYLKTAIEIEVVNQETAELLGRQKRDVRDAVLRYLSSLTVADTLGEEGKDKIQGEILARLETQIGKNKARRLYFNEFVVQ